MPKRKRTSKPPPKLTTTPPPTLMVKLKINAAALQAFQAGISASFSNPEAGPVDTPAKASKPKSSKTAKTPKSSGTAGAPGASSTPATSKSKSSKKSAKASNASNGAAPEPPTVPPTFPKIKIKTSALQQPSPVTAPAPPTRPKLKLTSSSFSHAPPSATTPLRTPLIKLKTTTKASPRKRRHDPGNGYDSEASDREDDPAIEENFILRMQPGPDCDYLREVIEKKELNVTSDVWMKFKDARRAVVNVRGHLYGALLVDLPCIVEASKTLDKKNIFKAADISQMLLVAGRIQTEEEVWSIKMGFSDVTFPHGLTPPMQFVRKRRFRKRISNRTIEAVEAEVDRLLRDDEEADSTRFQLVDAAELDREETAAPSETADDGQGYDLLGEEGYDDEQDAEGEVEVEYEYAPQRGGGEEVEVDTLANDLEDALFNGLDEADEVMVEVAPLETPVTADAGHAAGHAVDAVDAGDAGGGDSPPAAPGEESETSDEDEDDEIAEPELDESQQEKLQQKEKLKEEVQDLEEMLTTKAREFEKLENKMLKTRVGKVIAGLRSQLELKQDMLAQLGA